MQFVWWLIGVYATITACRFVILVFKRFTGKASMEDLIDKASNGFQKAADKVAENIKERKKEKREANKVRVTIH